MQQGTSLGISYHVGHIDALYLPLENPDLVDESQSLVCLKTALGNSPVSLRQPLRYVRSLPSQILHRPRLKTCNLAISHLEVVQHADF